MNTKYVTVVALVLVLLSTALIVTVPKDTDDSSETESREYGFFLDGVEDGDGFGIHIVTDKNSSYKLLRDALLRSVDPQSVPAFQNGELREAVESFRAIQPCQGPPAIP